MLSAVERSFDYTVIDTPPVGTFVDAAVVAAASSATALVVRENVARRADVVEARNQLEKAGANLVGIVMSCCELENSRYYYYEHCAG